MIQKMRKYQKDLRYINLFIEITNLINIQHYLLNISKMKLKLNFVTKVPKVARDNEVILINNKNIKVRGLKFLSKSIFTNKLFLEKKFLVQNTKDKNYTFVNCIKSKTSLDYEKLGSSLYIFLKSKKI